MAKALAHPNLASSNKISLSISNPGLERRGIVPADTQHTPATMNLKGGANVDRCAPASVLSYPRMIVGFRPQMSLIHTFQNKPHISATAPMMKFTKMLPPRSVNVMLMP